MTVSLEEDRNLGTNTNMGGRRVRTEVDNKVTLPQTHYHR